MSGAVELLAGVTEADEEPGLGGLRGGVHRCGC